MTDAQVTPPVQQGWNPVWQDPVNTDSSVVQKWVFGGSAEAVDNMVNNKPISTESVMPENAVDSDVPPVVSNFQWSWLDFDTKIPDPKEIPENDDSGETFNFDEISFDKNGSEELIVNSEKLGTTNVMENEVVDVPQEVIEEVTDEVREEAREKAREKATEAVIENVVDNDESVEKDGNNDQGIDVIHNIFDDLYENLETLYDMKNLEEENSLFLGNYEFVMNSFSEDIIKIKKWDVLISLELETGSFELFVNNQLLFSGEDLEKDSNKFEEVKSKLDIFLDMVKKELKEEKKKKELADAEIAAKAAEKQKHLDAFKAF